MQFLSGEADYVLIELCLLVSLPLQRAQLFAILLFFCMGDWVRLQWDTELFMRSWH